MLKSPISDFLFLFFLFYSLFVFLSYPDSALIDFIKFSMISIGYFLGRISYQERVGYRFLFFISAFAVLVFFVVSLFGVGYKQWGSVVTFSGGYYFKTDLAIAVAIFSIFIYVYLPVSFFSYLIFFSICGYLIFLSNSRICLPLIFLLPFLVWYFRKGGAISLGFLLLCIISMALFVLVISLFDFSAFGFLAIDFNSFFSGENLQGRNKIWAALISHYQTYTPLEAVFGRGYLADQEATSLYMYNFGSGSHRAHSSYFYLLLCTGIVGCLLFLCMVVQAVFIIFKSTARCSLPELKKDAIVFSCFMCIFLIVSLTTESIIRPQITVPLFLFYGRSVSNLKLPSVI
ncbi:O-antigen ligase family protein [Reinekea thalattae]|uniref:O-antigen ligase family protein n=1 Tax=Reinekea thalattae TaxID=2593301 RepID=UPI001650297A|nr:O-antigen ligase family protein [Reinekea thalattae]